MTSNQLSRFRLDELIKSNEVPSEQERTKLRYQIVTTQSEVDNLDKDIKKTKVLQVLDELVKRRKDQRQVLTSLKATVSAIRQFPFETLAQILVFAQESSGCKTIGIHLCYIHPLIFGHVCSRWRMVSHSTPMLWRSFSVDLSPNMLKAPEGTQELMKQWFSRAYPLPLDVDISFQITSRINLDLPSVDRMRKLKLNAPLVCFEKLSTCIMPLIEVLDLDIMHIINDYNNWNVPSISFMESPRLHTVILHSSDLLQNEMLALPWPQLTNLEFSYAHPPEDLLRLLSMATNLEKLVYNVLPRYFSSTLAPIVHHHNLRDLSIGEYYYDGAVQTPPMSFLFQHLTLPALRSMAMGNCGRGDLAAFSDMQSRSHFSLEALDLTVSSEPLVFDSLTPDVALVRFLHEHPSVVKLRLGFETDEKSYGRFLRALELPLNPSEGSSNGLLPCVEEMHLNCLETVGQEIVDVLNTRWRPEAGGVLKRFSVGASDKLSLRLAITDELHTFVRQGLFLNIGGFGLA